jgi:YVTN family beta-propeller protein
MIPVIPCGLATGWLISNTVSRINTASGNTVSTINVGTNPRGIMSLNNKIYVENYQDGTISIIDGTSHSVTGPYKVGNTPAGMAAIGNDVAISRFTDGVVSIFDTNTLALKTESVTDTTAPVITLTSTSTTATTALITFTTDEVATSTVSYGASTSYGLTSATTTATTTHSITLTGLTASTTYHYRLSSTDTAGNLATSSNLTFTTAAITPVVHTVVTVPSTSTTASTTLLTGNLTSTGTQTVIVRGFQYATDAGYSDAQTVFSSDNAGFATGTYSLPVTGLTCNTTYYYAAYASSNPNYVVGSTDTFTTGACPVTLSIPTLTIQSATSISTTTAVLNGSITSDGNASSTVRGFNYGTTTTYTATTSVGGSLGITTFSDTVTGLTCNTTYHYLAYAINSQGRGTSSDATFTTSACPVVENTSGGSSGNVSSGGGGWSTSGSSGGSSGGSSSFVAPTTSNISTTTVATSSKSIYVVENPIKVPLTKNNLCTPYILPSAYIALGKDNNSTYVQKIQSFLNTYEGAHLVVDGIYKKEDMTAVQVFQMKYKTQILSPRNIAQPTGVVAKTTLAKINAIVCGQSLGCPVFTKSTDLKSIHSDVPRIKNFLNQIIGTNLNTNTQSMDLATMRAISSFQTLYKDFILKPLGLPRATGLWYASTMKQANTFMGCEVR